MKAKEITSENMDALALEIIEFLQKNDLFQDVSIYCNNKRISSNVITEGDLVKTELGAYYVIGNCNVSSIVEFNNPNTITMTFEGPLYMVLNYGPAKTEEAFSALFIKYGLYYELGYAWSLAAYPV